MLNHFTFAKFRFTIRAVEEISLSRYKGAVFRGGFGYAFKKIVCIQRARKECSECLLHRSCVYSYIFETAPPEDTEVLRLYRTVPHPFIIEPPPDDARAIKQDDRLTFNMILIGRAVDYLPYFILTFAELGKQGIGRNRGKFILEKVEGLDVNGESNIIYTCEREILQNDYPLLDASQLNHAEHNKNNSQVEIEFLTPFRVRLDGKITDNIDFYVILRNLIRRVSSLLYFHCGREMECDFKSYIEKSEKVRTVSNDLQWFDWERYSTRQKRKMTLGGVLGNVKYEGNLEPFVQFLN
ncbi:MAG: CRISPR system precrRNA processing endoribonuclease RAMP protein Cas6 [Candidatus Scalindua sp.]